MNAPVERLKRVEPSRYLKAVRDWIARRIDEDRLQTLHAEDVALIVELDGGLAKLKGGVASNGSIIRFVARFQIVVTLSLFIVIAVWKYQDDVSFIRSDRLLLLNLIMGSIQGFIYLFTGISFCKHMVMAIKKIRVLDRRIDPRRQVAVVMASLDMIAGFVSISGFISANAVAFAHDGCGYFLGPVKALAATRLVALGVILANQMCLSIVATPVQMFFKVIDAVRAGWLVRIFDSKDKLRSVVLGVDLPAWVFISVFCVWFAPWVALVTLFILGISGPLGGNWCTSIYDTRCYPGASEGVDCHLWEYPCSQLSSTARAVGIAMSSYAIFTMTVYFVTIISSNMYLKRLPYTLYRTSHIELGFQLTTRMYTTVLFVLSTVVLWLIDSGGCDPHILLMVGFLPTEMVVCYLVSTTLVVRTPYFIDKEEFASMQWNKTFLWQNQNLADHQAARPALSQKSTMCFQRAIQAFFFSWVAYDIEEKPSSLFTIDFAMRLHDLNHFKLLWKKKLDAKAVMSWNRETRTIVVAIRGTASTKNACTDVKIFRAAHPPRRGRYIRTTMPLIHSGFAEFWYDSGLQADVLAMVDDIMGIDVGRPQSDQKPWEVWCYGHSLGGATAKLAALDIHRHLEIDRGMDQSTFSVSCYTYGCPYVGNKAFVDAFEDTIQCAWDLFHPNDAVSITGKWFFMYARCSQVCLVSRFGDLVLNPSGLERVSLHPFGLKLVKEHLLSTYATSLASIINKWTIVEEYAPPKHVDSLSNLLDNPAMVDLVALLESIATPTMSTDASSGADSDTFERSTQPISAGEQILMPLLRAWQALDLEALKIRAKRKR